MGTAGAGVREIARQEGPEEGESVFRKVRYNYIFNLSLGTHKLTKYLAHDSTFRTTRRKPRFLAFQQASMETQSIYKKGRQ